MVTEYIGTAQPVGSSHVASAPGVEVSSATVRSEMVALERDGYLVQPHTSAGRIPTDKGYRFFVDHLTEPGILGPTQRRQVSLFFDQVHGEMETMLERASGLLSELTSYAAVVVGPSPRACHHPFGPVGRPGTAVRPLGASSCPTGRSRSAPIELDREVSDEVLGTPGALLSAHLVVTRLGPMVVPKAGDHDVGPRGRLCGRPFGLIGAGQSRPTRCSSADRRAWPSPSTP